MAKMNLKEALLKVDRSQAEWVDKEKLMSALGLTYGGYDRDEEKEFQDRIKGYWLTHRCDTDTWVGLQALYFDGTCVGCIFQSGRKSSPEYQFIGGNVLDNLYQFLLPKLGPEILYFVDPGEEIETDYAVNFASEPIDKEGTVNGEACTLINRDRNPASEKIEVRFHERDCTEWISVQDFRMSIRLQKD